MSLDTVAITGISGNFPKCKNVTELYKNLCKKKDLLDEVPHLWRVMVPYIPKRIGRLNNLNKFDAGFFGIHYHQAQSMDPASRKLLEITVSAVIDAGIDPKSLRGSKTGVFVATSVHQESEKTSLYDDAISPHFGITGCTRSMSAQWLSYCLRLEGPSVSVDTLCSASLVAVEHALRAIESGQCDNAIVAGTSILLNYHTHVQYFIMGIITHSSTPYVFDNAANGTARSEAVVAIFLQKTKNAKRVYANITQARVNSDGFTEEGIVYPSMDGIEKLLSETYAQAQIKPEIINYIEAHATGTQVGDFVEVNAIEKYFCEDRKRPIYIGSIKSNIGHTETASGLCSVIKVILQMENNCLIPNANFKTSRKDIKAFQDEKIKVVTEITEDHSRYYGINTLHRRDLQEKKKRLREKL